MKLSTLLKPEFININSNARNPEELFIEIIEDLYSDNDVQIKKLICSKLLEREKLGSTSLGNSAAIPHAKIKGLEQTKVFLALSKNGIAFNSDQKNDLVNLIILILSPINSPVSHLQTLAAAAALLKNSPEFIEKTKNLNAIEILDYIKKIELEYDQ